MGSLKKSISGVTELFGCIAHPADHVRAPQLFNKIFEDQAYDKVMVPIDIKPEGLKVAIEGLRNTSNFKGAAVTIPHKLELAKLCDELGEGAQIAGAVNAIYFTADRKLIGNNFDGGGFVQGLYGENPLGLANPKASLKARKILIVGAGGAARAIALAISNEHPEKINIVNRSAERAEEVCQLLKEFAANAPAEACTQDTVVWQDYDVVINATSLGLYPDDPLPIPIHALDEKCLVCDIIMKPAETRLLKEANAHGFITHYGRHMLDYQLNLIGQFIGAV